jgi:hypothetical protein
MCLLNNEPPRQLKRRWLEIMVHPAGLEPAAF